MPTTLTSCLYTSLFMPIILDDTVENYAELINYLQMLQDTFKSMVEFCFDDSFYPNVLGHLDPSNRFELYCNLHHISSTFSTINDSMLSLKNQRNNVDSCNKKVLVARLQHIEQIENDDEYKSFCEKYLVDKSNLAAFIFHYDFVESKRINHLYNMLFYEFRLLVEHSTKINKCKRCGRYFVSKGNFKTNYCHFVAEGEKYSCQKLFADENYAKKVSRSEARKLYDKYYKRYYARSRVGTISKNELKKWQYQATMLRDDCEQGNLTIEDFTMFLHDSFVND